MLSFTGWWHNFADITKLAENNDMPFEYAHHGRIYRVEIINTGRKAEYNRGRRPVKPKVPGLKVDDCKECNNSVKVGGVCINKKCPSNNTPDPTLSTVA
jgi:hypothetical protein